MDEKSSICLHGSNPDIKHRILEDFVPAWGRSGCANIKALQVKVIYSTQGDYVSHFSYNGIR